MLSEYIGRLPPYNRDKPRFVATLGALLSPIEQGRSAIEGLPEIFDLDSAAGVQLDQVGEWVGRARQVFMSRSGRVDELADEDYRLLLRAKIAANQWDGTPVGAKAVLDIVFSGATHAFAQDGFDMSMIFGISGKIPSEIFMSLLTGGYIPLKPSGVRATYLVVSVDSTPMFGFDVDNEYISGFDRSSWGVAA